VRRAASFLTWTVFGITERLGRDGWRAAVASGYTARVKAVLRSFALAGLVALSSAVPAATVERIEIKGAHALVTIPDDWNGSLFLYAHGYTSDERIVAPIPEQFGDAVLVLLPGLLPFVPAGYATAVSTFRSAGWDVKDAIKDVENLRRWFTKKHGRPKHTYIWGHSGGGMITQALIEYFPRTYDGASPQCATGGGGRRLWNAAYDLRVMYEWTCRDVPDSHMACGLCTDGASRCVDDVDCPAGQTCAGTEAPFPPEDGLTAECTALIFDHPERFSELFGGGPLVARSIAACLGGETPTPDQAARRDLLTRASQIPANQLESDLFFASVALGEIVHRRTHGKHPWGNLGVVYASPLLTPDERTALDAGVHRSDADAAAVRYMRRFYEPRGRTHAKVITVHALDDGLVIPEHETKYRQAFEAAGRSSQLLQIFTATGEHCTNALPYKPALEALTAWVERGVTPTTESVDDACGNCLTTDPPGPFGVKSPERRQKGAPLASLVCTGLPGDCPAGTACDVAKHRCK
jgi:hypothetical protein